MCVSVCEVIVQEVFPLGLEPSTLKKPIKNSADLIYIYIYIYSKVSKFGDRSRG